MKRSFLVPLEDFYNSKHYVESAGTWYRCPPDQLLSSREHRGDENGTTLYWSVSMVLPWQLIQLEAGTEMELGPFKEAAGEWFDCPEDMLMIGRRHHGDENGNTYYTCAKFVYTGVPVLLSEPSRSKKIKESAGLEYETPNGTVLAGRWHKGDENGETEYKDSRPRLDDRSGRRVLLGRRVWSEKIKEAGSDYECPAGSVLTGRWHSGDENGSTRYQYACLYVELEGEPSLSVTRNRVQSAQMKESGSSYQCPPNTFLTGRWHEGDENGKTQYEYADVYIQGLPAASTDRVSSDSIKESAGIKYTCPGTSVMTGRSHSGDENGHTRYEHGNVALDLSKRYDQYCYLTAHNAYANHAARWRYAQQTGSLRWQLEHGARGLSLDIWRFSPANSDEDIFLCHEACDKYPNLNVPQRLSEALREVADFLEIAPDAVVTLLFESRVGPDAAALVQQAFRTAGVEDLLFYADRPTQLASGPWDVRAKKAWPTLEQLVESGKRLVVFSDRAADTRRNPNPGQAAPPRINDGLPYLWEFAIESFYGDLGMHFDTLGSREGSAALTDTSKTLFALNYFPTWAVGGVFPSYSYSVINDFEVNNSFGTNIRFHIDKYTRSAERPPNFLLVDFFELGGHGGPREGIIHANTEWKQR
jgi:hypothetical protein